MCRKKTSCILKGAVAPKFQAELVCVMQVLYSLSVDGSNDSDLLKMNSLTVQMFDENSGKVNTRFLDMCTTSGQHAATAEPIFFTKLIMFFVCIISHGTTVLA